MKKVLAFLLTAIFALSITGCGIKQKIENKIGEEIGEKILEGATGSNVDVEGDSVTIKGEDGSKLTLGGTEWPDSKLVKDLPKFEKGTLLSVSEGEDFVMIIFEGVEKDDFNNYWEKIKEDYTEETVSMELDDLITYGGGNGKGVYVQITFNPADGSFGINASKKE